MAEEKIQEPELDLSDPIYRFDGEISLKKAVPFGLQHVLAMFVANIAPILIVGAAVIISFLAAGGSLATASANYADLVS